MEMVMSPTIPDQAGNGSATDTGHNGAAAMPFNFQSHSDAFWSSFRSLSNAFLHTHHNTAALMQVNRKLADELLEIARRQQNYALEFSEKLLHQMSAASPVVKHVESMRPESFDEYFDSAIQGIREFGQAIAEAQVHSLETIGEHTLGLVQKAEDETDHAEAAE
jgi:hypothetical protein